MRAWLFCTALLLLLTATACTATPEAVTEEPLLPTLVWEEESETASIPMGGYPRFLSLQDGTLLLFNEGWLCTSKDCGASWEYKSILQNAATTAVSASGKTHTLGRENWQGFVTASGDVLVAYRSRTKDYTSGEFYTSIRVMTSTDNAKTFGNEVIVAEATTDSFHGFWEPFMIQPSEGEILLFYSDDLHVTLPAMQQNIVYHTYSVKNGTWSDASVAINGAKRASRDGMPVLTKLQDGGYAMVIETQDYCNRFLGTTFGTSVFVISISLSEDGKTWTEPTPIIAPEDIRGENRCAAPFITTLPDGRVVVSFMSEDGFTGTKVGDPVLNCVYGAVISTRPLSSTDRFSPTVGGTAEGFAPLTDVFADPENGYMVWNTVYCDGKYIYFAGNSGANDGSFPNSIRIRRATVEQ